MKTILSLIILVLIGAVGYLWTELNEVKKELKKEEPKVVITIHKNQENAIENSLKDINNSNGDLEEVVKKDFQKIFKDIFGNPDVQKQIKDSVNEFKKGLSQALNELQKNINDMDKESGKIFEDLLKNLNAGEYKIFTDKKDFYELIIDLYHDKNAKVEVDANGNILSIKVKSFYKKITENRVIKKESFKSYIVKIPNDAMIDMIKSEYKDGKLYITVPKKVEEKI